MRVKLLKPHVSPRGVFEPGTTLDVPDDEGKQLIAGSYAIAVGLKQADQAGAGIENADDQGSVETAQAPAPAATARQRPARGAKAGKPHRDTGAAKE